MRKANTDLWSMSLGSKEIPGWRTCFDCEDGLITAFISLFQNQRRVRILKCQQWSCLQMLKKQRQPKRTEQDRNYCIEPAVMETTGMVRERWRDEKEIVHVAGQQAPQSEPSQLAKIALQV